MGSEEVLREIVREEHTVDLTSDVDYIDAPEDAEEAAGDHLTVLDVDDSDVMHRMLGLASEAGVRQYRKRPVTIWAAQWDGSATGATGIINWVLANGGSAQYQCINLTEDGDCTDRPEDHSLVIETLEGVMATKPGGYVIRGLAGEFYPVDDSIFAESYDSVSGS